MATVKIFGNLRKLMDGSQLQVSGASIRSILETICEGNPPLYDALLENDVIRPYFKITINGHDIQLKDGLETQVGDDDQIAIFPPIAGG